MEGFLQEKGWGKRPIVKRKQKGEGRSAKGFIMQIVSSSLGEWGRSLWQIMWQLLIGADHKIPNSLRLHLWWRLKLQLGLVLNLALESWALAQVTPFWACGFFSLAELREERRQNKGRLTEKGAAAVMQGPEWECFLAAAAKSPQSCPTLCNPIDGSPSGSPVPGILQARVLEWVAISFSNAWKWKVKVKSLSRVPLFETPWTAAYQAPPSMGFSRQEARVLGCHCLLQGFLGIGVYAWWWTFCLLCLNYLKNLTC